jgi:quercetin dioxygenase-like cupin family protein
VTRELVRWRAHMAPGISGPLHLHDADETMLVVAGSGMALVDGEERALAPGTEVTVPEGAPHQVVNTGTEQLTLLFALADGARVLRLDGSDFGVPPWAGAQLGGDPDVFG